MEKTSWAALTLIRNKVFFKGSEEISSLVLKGVPVFGGSEIPLHQIIGSEQSSHEAGENCSEMNGVALGTV